MNFNTISLADVAIGAGVLGKTKGESLKKANFYGIKHLKMFLLMN